MMMIIMKKIVRWSFRLSPAEGSCVSHAGLFKQGYFLGDVVMAVTLVYTFPFSYFFLTDGSLPWDVTLALISLIAILQLMEVTDRWLSADFTDDLLESAEETDDGRESYDFVISITLN